MKYLKQSILKFDILIDSHIVYSNIWSPCLVKVRMSVAILSHISGNGCANKAIIRERHPIPTVDEILQDVQKGGVFSKLDLKWGYHQIELSEESRSIATFVTHKGLF
jgi:hypothetical protein